MYNKQEHEDVHAWLCWHVPNALSRLPQLWALWTQHLTIMYLWRLWHLHKWREGSQITFCSCHYENNLQPALCTWYWRTKLSWNVPCLPVLSLLGSTNLVWWNRKTGIDHCTMNVEMSIAQDLSWVYKCWLINIIHNDLQWHVSYVGNLIIFSVVHNRLVEMSAKRGRLCFEQSPQGYCIYRQLKWGVARDQTSEWLHALDMTTLPYVYLKLAKLVSKLCLSQQLGVTNCTS